MVSCKHKEQNKGKKVSKIVKKNLGFLMGIFKASLMIPTNSNFSFIAIRLSSICISGLSRGIQSTHTDMKESREELQV